MNNWSDATSSRVTTPAHCLPLLLSDTSVAAGTLLPDALKQVTDKPSTGFYLDLRSDGLTLQNAQAGSHDHGLRIDLLDGHIERRLAGARKSPLARAFGLRRHPAPSVLDTTCGLGRDSATLAALGCRVHALERHPALFALLDDALARARADTAPPGWLSNWRSIEYADARCWLATDKPSRFDVIYIDPMFAAPRRKARPQKALAWLNELVGTDGDAHELLAAARRHAARQTVVKQHARGEPIAATDRQVYGKALRFDIYLRR